MNVISIEAKLIAIHIGLILAMENNNTYNIIVLTDFISAANKVLESHINAFQNIIIILASGIKSFLKRDKRNAIYFWYYPSKAK